MQNLLFALGAGIVILTFLDFFYTTLSGKGFWKISGSANSTLSKIILLSSQKSLINFSGLLHIILSTTLWLIMLLCGCFFVFASSETMVVASTSKEPASLLERLYFTCYTISTLGMGDFEPGNNLSKVLTGFLSFSGFILLTIAMTYLLNVISAVLQKKQLAFFISSLGKDPLSLYRYYTSDPDLNTFMNHSADLRQLILQNASSYGYYPIVHYFLTPDRRYSVEIQVASLYEVVLVLQEQSQPGSSQSAVINSLRNAIATYMDMGIQSKEHYEKDQEQLNSLRQHWHRKGFKLGASTDLDHAVTASLKSAGWKWSDVYSPPPANDLK